MTYIRGVPNEDEQGLASQPKLLQNTNALDDIFDIDHYKFSDNSNDRGKHRAARFKDQTSAGDPSTLSDEFAIYAKEDSDGDLELFYREPTNGPVNQLTKTGNLFSGLVPAAAVNFDNSGAIQSQFNVSGVVRNSIGDYTITYTTPLPNNNYDWTMSAQGSAALLVNPKPGTYNDRVKTTEINIVVTNLSGVLANSNRISVMIFRPPS